MEWTSSLVIVTLLVIIGKLVDNFMVGCYNAWGLLNGINIIVAIKLLNIYIITNAWIFFVRKCEKLLHCCKSFSHFSNTISVFLAHLSRRLMGAYRIPMVRGPSGRRPSSVRPQCSKIFFSETPGLIKAKFYVEPPWVGGTIFCSRHLGHMTKMAATPIYGKNPLKIFFSRTSRPIFTKLGM